MSAQLSKLEDKKQNTEPSSQVKSLLTKFSDIFQDPKGLLPHGPCDHAIKMLPGSKHVNLPPYRYSSGQKNTIEKMVKEMMEAQIIATGTSLLHHQLFW